MRSGGRTPLKPFAAWPVLLVAGAGVGLLLMVAGRYGYHRDELYFLACAKRLAWGFVDQPPLTPAIAKLSQAVAPGSLVALRAIPALIYGALVVVTALIARELGAGRTGQIGSSVCAASATGFFLSGHLLSTTTLVGGAVWVAGLLRLLRDPNARTYRALAFAYVLLAVTLAIAAGDKPYYVAGLYVPLFGAGGLSLERWIARHRDGSARVIAAIGFALTTVLLLPVAIPILPLSALASVPVQDANPELGEQIGWPELVSDVAHVWRSLPASERQHAVVLTSNYGEAGAIDRFGPAVDLPSAYSGHNTYWWWRRPPNATRTIVAVGFQNRSYLESFFDSVRRAGTIQNGWGVENDEQACPSGS